MRKFLLDTNAYVKNDGHCVKSDRNVYEKKDNTLR